MMLHGLGLGNVGFEFKVSGLGWRFGFRSQGFDCTSSTSLWAVSSVGGSKFRVYVLGFRVQIKVQGIRLHLLGVVVGCLYLVV